jgi:hypothetical protein
MPEATSAALVTPGLVTGGHRVIYHPPLCPDCGSGHIGEAEVDTGDGVTEIALICEVCGCAWPVACVVDWDTPPRGGRG